jgi:hypothetical protein
MAAAMTEPDRRPRVWHAGRIRRVLRDVRGTSSAIR